MAAAGSTSVVSADLGGGYTKYTIAWLSSAGGAVTEIPLDVGRGHIHQVTFEPDSGGTQPTDLYDATLLDANNLDVFGGVGANLSNAAVAAFVPLVGTASVKAVRHFHEGGAITPTIANAGNAKGGTIILIMGP